MYVSILLTALLGVSSALENPHKKAPVKKRGATPNTQRANSAHEKRAYLTDKSKSRPSIYSNTVAKRSDVS
jgi:hypothetical protein